MNDTNKSVVVLIDDDHGPMNYFIEALKMRGFDVEHIDCVDKVFEELVVGRAKVVPDILVVDLMMPYGKHLSAEQTRDGMDTGFFVIERCREKFPDVPIVCLSNVSRQAEVKQRLEAVPHVAKYEVSPFAFADEIKKLLHNREHR
jgi:CheY-like chemotaxis protein